MAFRSACEVFTNFTIFAMLRNQVAMDEWNLLLNVLSRMNGRYDTKKDRQEGNLEGVLMLTYGN
jgi:hypothetical protein